MAKMAKKSGRGPRFSAAAAKYDAHHTVLSKTYGALADLRRELADSKSRVSEREEVLKLFASCADSQRAWLLLEDYFEKLALSRKYFTAQDWWPRVLAAKGRERLEELAILFLRANRPLPTELTTYANLDRFAEIEEAEQEQQVLSELENWMFPPAHTHLDGPRAKLHVFGEVISEAQNSKLQALKVHFNLFRPRTGERHRSIGDLIEITTRSAHEQELFAPADWQFLLWLGENYTNREREDSLKIHGLELLQWLARWGHTGRIEFENRPSSFTFDGQIAEFSPFLENGSSELAFTHRLKLPDGSTYPISAVKFFAGQPPLALVDTQFFLLRNAPSSRLLEFWSEKPGIPVRKLSNRMRTQLRRTQTTGAVDWEQLCVAHPAKPQFVFELSDETVRLRLRAVSERDASEWHWTGQEWQLDTKRANNADKPHILEDPRLEPATYWLRRLDWFTPEPGMWVGDANENFLGTLAQAWPDRPEAAEFLGNQAFHRLFMAPRQLKPKLIVKGSGIDWFTVSTEWEHEGMKLSAADLQRLAVSNSRFVKLPDAGWVELDTDAVSRAHETMADLNQDALSPIAQRISLDQAAHLDEGELKRFADSPELRALKTKLADFEGIPDVKLPGTVQAEMRPYQKDGFDFLCHLTRAKLGGILADDMGLGKTLQTLAWMAWLRDQQGNDPKPTLVICPASVLHNWRREAEKFTPHLKVLVLESGSARHNLRKQIPQHDIIVTNYALLRRDLEALQKFPFSAVILDEAQFIKNPAAQITQSVKQLKATQRLALTGTPLENRLLDLWSIVDFIQPGYLGTQEHFHETYQPRGEGEADQVASTQRIARRRLAAKLRPLMLRRLKKQVAKDLPDRIEERRDCELGDLQRKLYLAELRRSREQVAQIVAEKGLNKSKMHVLAALTRLRQICCHPTLVGND